MAIRDLKRSYGVGSLTEEYVKLSIGEVEKVLEGIEPLDSGVGVQREEKAAGKSEASASAPTNARMPIIRKSITFATNTLNSHERKRHTWLCMK